MIKVNNGVWIIVGSIVPVGFVIQEIYDGQAPSIIMVYEITLLSLALEFTENFKPRINGFFPFLGIVIPAGVVLAHMDSGMHAVLNYIAVLIGFFILLNTIRHLRRKFKTRTLKEAEE